MYHTYTHIYTARQNVVSRRITERDSSKHEENKIKNEIVELQTLKDIRAKKIYFF